MRTAKNTRVITRRALLGKKHFLNSINVRAENERHHEKIFYFVSMSVLDRQHVSNSVVKVVWTRRSKFGRIKVSPVRANRRE